MASPVRLGLHGEPHAAIMGWLFAYVAKHPDVRIGDNATVLLEGENEVQPDAFLLRSQAHENEEGYVEGAPELVVEIAASSASYDLFEKKRVYLRSGVREYIVWQTDDKRLDWFRLTRRELRRGPARNRMASSRARVSPVCGSTFPRFSAATSRRFSEVSRLEDELAGAAPSAPGRTRFHPPRQVHRIEVADGVVFATAVDMGRADLVAGRRLRQLGAKDGRQLPVPRPPRRTTSRPRCAGR